MKNIKYLLLLMLSISTLTSCVDDGEDLSANAEGSNVAGFTNARENISNIANGDEYTFALKMKVAGPTVMDLTNPITVTYAATAASTAIEGVHYRIDDASTILSKDNNYLGFASVVMLTDGIDAPLAGPSPVLVLIATATTGDGTVVASGKPVTVTLNYACDSNLDGAYTETIDYTRKGVFQNTTTRTVSFTKTGVGEYRTSHVGHWAPSALGGTPGFTFYDVCGIITIPGQNLVDLYSNWVVGVAGASSIDPVTGIITMDYAVESPQGTPDRVYHATYVKQ